MAIRSGGCKLFGWSAQKIPHMVEVVGYLINGPGSDDFSCASSPPQMQVAQPHDQD